MSENTIAQEKTEEVVKEFEKCMYDCQYDWKVKKELLGKICDYIVENGFRMGDLSWVEATDGTWEFRTKKDRNRGFLIRCGAINEVPIPEYRIQNKDYGYTFIAKDLSEAYKMHNYKLTEEDRLAIKEIYTGKDDPLRAEMNALKVIVREKRKAG